LKSGGDIRTFHDFTFTLFETRLFLKKLNKEKL
jgi:hypothetical protein